MKNKEKKKMIKIVCAWCGKGMGEKDGKGQVGISHSICKDCIEKELGELNTIKKE